MTPGEKREKELLAISPRSSPEIVSMSTQKTGATTKEKTVKIRIPWWNELISKEESELKVENKRAREDLIQRCVSKHNKQSKHGKEPHGRIEAHRLKISDKIIPTVPTSMKEDNDDQDWGSEDEYHDPMSDLEDLSKMVNIEMGHNNLEPGSTGAIDTDDETNEDDEYQDPLVEIITKSQYFFNLTCQRLARFKNFQLLGSCIKI